MVLQERVLGLTFLEKLSRCAPEEMKVALIARLAGLPPFMRRSVTFDSGQKNRRHEVLKSEFYFGGNNQYVLLSQSRIFRIFKIEKKLAL